VWTAIRLARSGRCLVPENFVIVTPFSLCFFFLLWLVGWAGQWADERAFAESNGADGPRAASPEVSRPSHLTGSGRSAWYQIGRSWVPSALPLSYVTAIEDKPLPVVGVSLSTAFRIRETRLAGEKDAQRPAWVTNNRRHGERTVPEVRAA